MKKSDQGWIHTVNRLGVLVWCFMRMRMLDYEIFAKIYIG
jgi:hypothetical protein